MNLPREKLIGLENTQPFTYKNLIFAHSGLIKALEARKKLGKYDDLIKRVNDSEVYFALLIKHWFSDEKQLYAFNKYVEGEDLCF